MARKNRTPEENARREKIRELLQMANIGSMDDIQNLFKETIAEFMENGLEAELDDELGYSKYDYKNKDTDNSRNGHSSKTLRTSFGDVEVSVPRDRKGEFEPQVLKKNQTSISQDIEEKILSMYAKGMTTSDIEAHIQDIYGISVSDSTVSRITDKILPIAKEWQQRPLEPIYAVVFLDAIHYHVRSEGQIVKKAVYIAIGVNLDGRKDVLGMWVGENESAKFWATVLNGLKNRGVEDIFIACTDNLTGFDAAIHASLSPNRDPELHHPPAAQFQQICVLQGPEGTYGRSEGGLCRCGRAGRPGCSGRLWGALGQEIPENLPVLAMPTGPISAPISSIPRRYAG